MNTLLMDTSSQNMLVGLNVSGTLIEAPKMATSKHLETLMPAVDSLLMQKDYQIANIDYIGVVVGPGSFTGIRIAVSSAKAMMMANDNIKAVAVNSLELLAESYYKNKGFNEDIVCVIPTTIKKVYYCLYEKGKKAGEDSICEVENLGEIAKGRTIVSPKLVTKDTVLYEVTTKDLNNFVEKKLLDEEFETNLSPIYIGLSQAEEQLKAKENK